MKPLLNDFNMFAGALQSRCMCVCFNKIKTKTNLCKYANVEKWTWECVSVLTRFALCSICSRSSFLPSLSRARSLPLFYSILFIRIFLNDFFPALPLPSTLTVYAFYIFLRSVLFSLKEIWMLAPKKSIEWVGFSPEFFSSWEFSFFKCNANKAKISPMVRKKTY